jgi:hypothetical protein
MHRFMLVHELTHWRETCQRKSDVRQAAVRRRRGVRSRHSRVLASSRSCPVPEDSHTDARIDRPRPQSCAGWPERQAGLRCHLPHLSQSVMPCFAAQVILAAMNGKPARSLAPALHVPLWSIKHTRIWGPRKAASHQPLPLSRIAFASIDPDVDECIGLFSPNELC